MFSCLKADIFLSYRLLSGQHLSFVLEKGLCQGWDPWEGRSSGALEVLMLSLTALLCAEQAWLGGFTLRQAENQQDRAQS